MKRKILAGAALAIIMGSVPLAQAATAPASNSSCLEPVRLYSWKVVNDRTVIVTDRLHRDYKVSLVPGCYNLKFVFQLGFKSFSPSRLSCMGEGDYVLAPGGGGLPRQTCRVDSVVAYTPAMQRDDAINKALDGPH